MPAVSVVIPAYNHRGYVGDAVRSVLGQSFTDLELLVIDDGSTDGTTEALTTLSDPRLGIERVEHQGIPATLNRGLMAASGDLFCYLGSDDLWDKMKLERQVAAMYGAPNAVAGFADCWLIDGEGRRTDRLGRQYDYRGGDIFLDLLRGRFHPPSPTNMFRRSAILRAGSFDEDNPIEDRDLWLRVAMLGDVVYVPEPLASHRVHGSNFSTTRIDTMYQSNLRTLQKMEVLRPDLTELVDEMRVGLDAHMAAAFYNALRFRDARRWALRCLRRHPTNRLALTVLARTAAGTRLVSRTRRKRLGARLEGLQSHG